MLAAWPRAGHLTSLSLSFLTCTWSCDGASCTVFACLEPWLAAVSSQDCRLPAGVLRACDKVTPQALPQAGWAQGTVPWLQDPPALPVPSPSPVLLSGHLVLGRSPLPPLRVSPRGGRAPVRVSAQILHIYNNPAKQEFFHFRWNLGCFL